MDPAIRVLHVDDEPDFAELAASFLEREDDRLSVLTANSASRALDVLDAEDVDCIVSDYEMPDRSGLELLRTVRERHPSLPFILFTGKGSEEIASEAISAGVTEYLQKEVGTGQYAVLANRITNTVEQTRAIRAAEASDEKLRQLAERTDDVLFMFDADWSELLFVNSAYEDIWGRSIEELRSDPRSFLEFVHPEDGDRVRRAMETLSRGSPDEVEYRVVPDDGTQRWVRTEGKPITGEDGDVERIVGFVRDVTGEREYAERIEGLHQSSRLLMEAETDEEVAERTTRAAKRTLGFPRTVVRLLRDGQLVPVAVSEEMELDVGQDRPSYDVGQPTAGLAFERGETLVYGDLSEIDDDVERTLGSGMYVPIGEHGVLTVNDTDLDAFDGSDVSVAEILAMHAETALDRVTRLRTLRERSEDGGA